MASAVRRDKDRQAATVSDLVIGARNGDQAAWNEIVDRFSRLVWKRIGAVTRCPTLREDAFQATWLKLAENLDTIRDPACLPGWIGVTARNEALRLAVLATRDTPWPSLELGESTDRSPDALAIAREQIEAVTEAMACLDGRDLALLQLRYFGDDRGVYDQISAQLGMPRGSIGPTLRRTLDRVATLPPIVALRSR
jgi:RNA polymerase sigma factor (sigma-70 family)